MVRTGREKQERDEGPITQRALTDNVSEAAWSGKGQLLFTRVCRFPIGARRLHPGHEGRAHPNLERANGPASLWGCRYSGKDIRGCMSEVRFYPAAFLKSPPMVEQGSISEGMMAHATRLGSAA